MGGKLRVTIWNEFLHEKESTEIAAIYPRGMHAAIAEGIGAAHEWSFATLEEPEHGLTVEKLVASDVLIWWGHMAHARVSDEIVDRVQQRVLQGMGLIVLHSGHHSKIFRRLLGTSCNLRWREAEERERIWVVEPSHPIAAGLDEHFVIPHEEMYGERFDIPAPEETVFISWFEGGEVFRSGVTYTRGLGRIFYFRPGHETHPTYRQPEVLRVIDNAIRWAAYSGADRFMRGCPNIKEPLEPIGRS